MASELNMYQAESTEFKYEIERLARELQETKKRYFEQKRKDIAARERNITMNATTEGPAHAALTQTTGSPRFMGGGFKLAHTTRELEAEQA